MLWEMLAVTSPYEAHRVESRVLAERGGSPDAAEGVTAFLEKRPAAFPMAVSKDMPPLDDWLSSKTRQS
jgi:hypothetical protein